MKKTIVYLTAAFIALGFIGFGAFKVSDKQGDAESSKSAQVSDEKAMKESTQKMEGLEFAQSVPKNASENALWAMMHKMTHQKVVASEKWGLIRMNDESIAKAEEILLASDFNSKEDLLQIIERWKNGQFDQVDDEHNFIWGMQGGSIGEARGILTEEQEKEFIENNFTSE
ncbi:DUF6241 domain-containing protein [uncultured Planococcus sp.]|uniref:DUF6241 domain-containing protein n=1 Tax=uncultured Planococcus sp. TaxID=337815 RepID=UPI00260AE561|nr:DUF6241 domain-containing protein [uncultured Planococcus sp.]